jgi:hypothetical protein
MCPTSGGRSSPCQLYTHSPNAVLRIQQFDLSTCFGKMDPAKLHQLSDSPLWNLPDTDPRCNNVSCMAYLVGYLEEQHVYSNDRYPKYAFWATYFYCATIGLFTIMYINSRIRDGGSGTRFKERTIAAWRWWTYRRIPGWLGTQMDISLGQLALFTSATIFIAIIAFLHGHYLRNYFKYGSPPLSVRSAIIISALLPICLAVAGKVNIVSVITGISYAKLNVWHRYLAFMIFILSIVHLVSIWILYTDPFLTDWELGSSFHCTNSRGRSCRAETTAKRGKKRSEFQTGYLISRD